MPFKDPEQARAWNRNRMRRVRAADPDGYRQRQAAWRSDNLDRVRGYTAKWRASNPDHKARSAVTARDWFLKTLYGLEPGDYDAMLTAQGGVCAICHEPPGDKRLCVDHDHETGRVRGLLCVSCNGALGLFHDRIDVLLASIDYLVTNEAA